MHELSIALGIVQIAEKELHKSSASRIDEIELDIGELSGIEFESLEFVWPSAVENTVLQSANRKINTITGKAICLDCDTEFRIKNHYDSCPACGSLIREIINGRELRVKSILVS